MICVPSPSAAWRSKTLAGADVPSMDQWYADVAVTSAMALGEIQRQKTMGSGMACAFILARNSKLKIWRFVPARSARTLETGFMMAASADLRRRRRLGVRSPSFPRRPSDRGGPTRRTADAMLAVPVSRRGQFPARASAASRKARARIRWAARRPGPGMMPSRARDGAARRSRRRRDPVFAVYPRGAPHRPLRHLVAVLQIDDADLRRAARVVADRDELVALHRA